MALFHEQYNLIYAAKLPEIEVVDADPAVDKFIACAVELEAEIIVSGDEHLLSVGNYGEIAVQSPADFLQNISK